MLASTYLPAPLAPWFSIVFNLTQLAMAVHVLWLVAQGWRGDLVEVRRQLRGPFLVTVTTYILVTRSFDVLHRNHVGQAVLTNVKQWINLVFRR